MHDIRNVLQTKSTSQSTYEYHEILIFNDNSQKLLSAIVQKLQVTTGSILTSLKNWVDKTGTDEQVMYHKNSFQRDIS